MICVGTPAPWSSAPGASIAIGAKCERSGQRIYVYLPYIGETQDEKMYRVVMDRERWFNVVMGESYRTDARSTDEQAEWVPFPESAANTLAFDLGVVETRPTDGRQKAMNEENDKSVSTVIG